MLYIRSAMKGYVCVVVMLPILSLMKMTEVLGTGRKHFGKGEIACYEQFLLFPRCFQKNCTADMYEHGLFRKGLTDIFCLSKGRKRCEKMRDWKYW